MRKILLGLAGFALAVALLAAEPPLAAARERCVSPPDSPCPPNTYAAICADSNPPGPVPPPACVVSSSFVNSPSSTTFCCAIPGHP